MKIDLSKLKRNYKETPLKRGEYPEVDDIKYLFIDCGLSKEETAQICNCNPEKVKIICRKYNIRKTKEQKAELRKRTNLLKYGVENISQLEGIKDKKKKTCLENYGVENPAQSKEIFNKIKETCLEKYGVESSNSTEDKKQAIRNTLINKYGVDNVMKVFTIKESIKDTNREKFGFENPMLNSEIKNKQKETNLEKYGAENLYGSDYFKEKTKQTNIEKYGVENVMKIFNKSVLTEEALKIKQKIIDNIPNMVAKSIETKRKNNSFNTSSIEDKLYKLLTKIFIVKRQYNSAEYPFCCDFYLPELDLYIEYNGTWTHGGFPYEDNEICNRQLNRWKLKAKQSKFYENAIYTWTDLDVRKRNIALNNKLNWLCFYSEKEFMEWYKQICEILK